MGNSSDSTPGTGHSKIHIDHFSTTASVNSTASVDEVNDLLYTD